MQQTLDARGTVTRIRARPARMTGLDRRSLGVVSAAAVLSLGSAVYFHVYTDMLTVAGDMATHLNLARRVLDNLTPGFGNLGGYWLPLLHFLEVPFVWNDTLWRSGLAGGIVSMASFVVGSLFTFRLARLLLEDDVRALIAATIFFTNPMLLYFQTAPLFEPLLIATFVGAVYYLARWTLAGQQMGDLLLCGLWTALATLVRQDNWMLLLAVPVIIQVVSRRLWQDRGHREAVLSAYIPLASQGVLVFVLVLNWILLGNPVYFFKPSFRPEEPAYITEPIHIAYTKGHLMPSFLRYPLAVAHNTGFLLFGAFLVGLVIFAIKERGSNRALVAYTLLLPFGFYFALMFFLGTPPIMVPELFPGSMKPFFNVRYGITALPAVAIFIAYLARNHWLKLCMSGLIAVQLGMLIFGGRFYPQQVGNINGGISISDEDREAINWLRENAREGLILMSTQKTGQRVRGDTIIIHSGFPNRRFINESTQHYWEESLQNPGKYAQWVVVKGGAIADLMERHPERFAEFDPVFELSDGTLSIYRRSVVSDQ